jgi:hypothetical protein
MPSLNDFNPATRARIVSQLAADTQAAAARRNACADSAGIHPSVTEPDAPPPLDRNPKGKRARPISSGRRYRVEYTIYMTSPFDWDNAAAAIKFAQDELVRQGWLPDGDGWRELEGVARAVKCATKAEQRTEIKLKRIN